MVIKAEHCLVMLSIRENLFHLNKDHSVYSVPMIKKG